MPFRIYDLRVGLAALAGGCGLLALYIAYSFSAGAPEARAYAGTLAQLPAVHDACRRLGLSWRPAGGPSLGTGPSRF